MNILSSVEHVHKGLAACIYSTTTNLQYIHIGTDTAESDECVMEADMAWYTCDKGSVRI
jgi:hypothetical protein